MDAMQDCQERIACRVKKAYNPSMPHKDPKAAKEYQAAYRAANREKARLRTAQWRKDNPEKAAKLSGKWEKENPEKAAEKRRAWREKNREKNQQTQREWRERVGYNQRRKERGDHVRQQLKTYGLTEQSFAELLNAQGGCCAICGQSEPGMKNSSRLYVDHCHETGLVRGLLCRACNTMLGNAKDMASVLRAGAEYLERAKDSRVVCAGERRLLEQS